MSRFPVVVGLLLLSLVSAAPVPLVPEPAAVPLWQLRSKHFIYGMPVPSDARHQITLKSGRVAPGISVLVKEGFVIGHYDKFKVPAWVATRWTEADYRQSEAEKYNERKFQEDDELPNYAVGGTSLDFKTSRMQRGHMSRQQDNKAWGSDNVDEGCEMSNIVPQHEKMNGAAWNDIEDAHRSVVANPASGIKAVWIISGPIFKDDKPNMLVGNGIGVPDACFKVIGWFDRQNRFNTRAYIVRQSDTKKGSKNYLTTVDAVEQATGLDFFSELADDQENRLEAEQHTDLWK